MDLAAAPWRASYPAGLSPDVTLAGFPVHAIVDEAAGQWPDRTAAVFRGATVTFAELALQVDRAGRAFQSAGVRSGTRVALLFPNTIHHLVAFFGVLKAGGTVVHLSPLDGGAVIRHKLADSGARLLVTTNIGDLATRAVDLSGAGLVDRLVVAQDEAFGPSPLTGPMPKDCDFNTFADFLDSPRQRDDLPDVALDDLALLQYTGGTTGMPKGAMLTHRNLSTAVESYDLWFDAWGLMRRGEERVLLFLPLFHIYSLSAVMLRCVRAGQTMVIHTRFDPETALREIEAGATSFPGVPTMWIAISAVPGVEGRDFTSLRYCASGGAPLPVETARRLKTITGHDLLGGWGMTETSPAGTNIPPTRPDKVGTIGIPLPGIHLDVVALDDTSLVLPQGEIGELRVFGPNVTAGYLNQPAENARAFSNGGFLTGDIGFMDAEGFFTIVDRRKDMILSGGFNVYPQLIEQMIYEHPNVEEVLVIGIPDDYRGEAAKAFVKLRAGAAGLSLDELRAFLKDRLGPHEIPAALEIRDGLPRTSVGKLSKLELKQEEAERRTVARAS
ncbi:dicarboxylate--CoA ligase PimA [Aquibium carbonis]|uniref:Long-chain-fatty-acid--CoA ligase n=1 Tax=Aquibium carbonis TaxID=2495581 RepID=A0A429Z3I8_9HYPH|nr:AMP-binding protein [Aquibium carbonis]RST88194.1 dicarboxylate--CoA ligase PimA [Aquibium carbonis]